MVQVKAGVRTEYLDVMTRVKVRRWSRKVLTMMVTCVHIRVCQEKAAISGASSQSNCVRGVLRSTGCSEALSPSQTVTSTLHTCLTSWLTSCLLCFTNNSTTAK